MRISIVTNTIYRKEPSYVAITDELKTEWCSAHGVEYIRSSYNPHPDLHPVWCKPSVLLRFFAGRDWLVWMDADAAPVGDVVLAGLLASAGDRVVMARDINGWNAGVFAVPCTDFGRHLLGTVDSHAHDAAYQLGFREQQCMADIFDHCPDVVFEPPREFGWNCYPNIYNRQGDPNIYKRGDFCLHIPGASDAARERIFKEVLNEIHTLRKP